MIYVLTFSNALFDLIGGIKNIINKLRFQY